MAVFSVNQATQFYTGNKLQAVSKNGLKYYVVKDATGAIVGKTDIIKEDCILSEKNTTVAEMNVKAASAVLTVTKVTAGEQYLIRLNIENWYNDTCTGNYLKTIAVTGVEGAEAFAAVIREALNKAVARDLEAPYKVKDEAGAVVTIDPEVYHTVGKRFVCPNISATVVALKAAENSDDIKVTDKAKSFNDVAGTGLMKLKDLEFFCAGEKGDIYRGVGYPNDIPFVSKLAGVTDKTAVKTIHYYETLAGEAVQKSEKTMILVGTVE